MPVEFGPPNNTPDAEREDVLWLMRGSAVKILVGPKSMYGCHNQDWRTWWLSKAWLARHSRHFSNATNEYLATSDSIIINSDPDSFGFFVEFMMRGQYSYYDDLKDYHSIRHSAKAWMLGEFLEAPKFQNLVMRNLYRVYRGKKPLSGIGLAAIEYVCENCTEDSPLYRFFQDVTVTFWKDKSVVNHKVEVWDRGIQWKDLWERFPAFRDTLLARLAEGSYQIKHIKEYLIKEYEWENSKESIEQNSSNSWALNEKHRRS